MVATEGIKISEETKKGLDNLKTYPRETYDDVISRLVHADVNAGYNIIKKASPKAFSNGREWIGGDALSPLCCCVTHKGTLSNV